MSSVGGREAVQFRSLLREWQHKREQGDADSALQVLAELVGGVRRERLQSPDTFQRQELEILGYLIAELQEREWHDQALAVCSAAESAAESLNAPYEATRFRLQGSHSCCALLDFESGFAALGRCVALEGSRIVEQPEHGIRCLSALYYPQRSSIENVRLRTEALLAVGRCFSIAGRLYSAQLAFDVAISAIEGEPELRRSISSGEVWYAVAELSLDRGELEHTRQILFTRPELENASDERWGLIEAQALLLEGELSRALELLDIVSARRNAPRVASHAQWLSLHVLSCLNQFDRCEDRLSELARDEIAFRDDCKEIGALLRERRSSAASEIVPAARTFLLPSIEPGGVGELPELPAPGGPRLRLRRVCERLRDDYGRYFNAVLVALNRSMVEEAAVLAGALQDWASGSESPLIEARQEHLWAFVHYYSGNTEQAAEHAAEAAHRYREMGLLPDLWTMHVLLSWCARRLELPAEIVARTRNQATELQDAITLKLNAEHRGQYQLNKWSTIDEQLASHCDEMDRRLRDQKSSHRARRRIVRATVDLILERYREADEQPTNNAPKARAGVDLYGWAVELRGRRSTEVAAKQSEASYPSWLGAGKVVVKYVSFPDKIVIFRLHRGMWTRIEPTLPSTKVELWEANRRMLAGFMGPARWRPTETIRDIQRRLGLDVILSEVAPGSQLIVVPDDTTLHIPIAALPFEDRPICERNPVSVVPTFRWDARRLGEAPNAARGLAVAVNKSQVPGYSDLVGTHDAALDIAKTWPVNWTVLAEALRDQVLEAIGSADLAQFFCHGDFDVREALSSGLVMADKWLTIRDLMPLDLRSCKLVVLASCWGADGVTLPGGMRIGLPFTLLDRGAEAVVAPLWDVPLAASLELVREAHAAMRKEGPVLGLARIQARWADEGRPCRQWAGWMTYLAAISPRGWARLFLSLRAAVRKIS